MIDTRTSDRGIQQPDVALMAPEGFLQASLQKEERQRKTRWLWVSAGSTLLLLIASIFVAATSTSEVSAAGMSTSDKTAEGWTLWRQRKLEDAELTFLDALRLNENDAEAWSGVGWCRNNRGEHEKAIEAFRKCLALNPNHGAAINGIGQSSLALQDWEEAEKWLYKGSKQVLDTVPEEKMTARNLPAAWFGLVQVYLITDQYDDAKVWARRILKHRPDDERIKNFLAQAKKKDNSELKKTLAEIHERIEAGKSWQNLSRGNRADAVKGFRALVDKNPNDIGALNGLAFSLLNGGKHEEAKPLFEKCLELNAKHYGAMNGLARCLSEAGEQGKAVKLWQQMCDELNVPNAGTAALGRHYLNEKDYAKAVKYLKQLADTKGPMGDAYQKMLQQAEDGLAAVKNDGKE